MSVWVYGSMRQYGSMGAVWGQYGGSMGGRMDDKKN